MRTFPFICLLSLLVACEPATKETTTSTSNPVEAQETTADNKKGKIPVIKIVQRTHKFSSASQPDYFRLVLTGDSITTGNVAFTITAADGQKIYEEQFTAADLEAAMVYEMETPTAPIRDREAYILRRMEEFVQEDDFVTPAIPATMRADTAFVSLTTFKAIQANPSATGFKYLLGKEDGRLLVYDPSQKKAIRYGSFGG
ncbi:hypothetical protein TH61_02440 [Rufibacter sp. DG15C]|uniref:hypothetical protein n=1 Tax=Rufibacter sp. DG15C TaxID=1379909 RepID=UPI00078DB2B6|nr:hypothetical protein [Rufibacter sp. DG15C]AMM50265.1 hypothetical protein TH61_02440 [Rufibacter sp. DG15C]